MSEDQPRIALSEATETVIMQSMVHNNIKDHAVYAKNLKDMLDLQNRRYVQERYANWIANVVNVFQLVLILLLIHKFV